ncbi:MAG: DUF2752 domain-containing protein [Turneriella sp.]|nr:DUF2752 domain-containing protein [Turneriella sp.]
MVARAHKIALLALGLMLLSVLVLLYLERPAAGGIFPPCPFLWLTGFYCPGCGSLRAIHELLHLRIAAAWSLNPLLIAAIPFVAMVLLYRLKKKTLPAFVYYAVISTVLLFWIARNLPYEPFKSLAPH